MRGPRELQGAPPSWYGVQESLGGEVPNGASLRVEVPPKGAGGMFDSFVWKVPSAGVESPSLFSGPQDGMPLVGGLVPGSHGLEVRRSGSPVCLCWHVRVYPLFKLSLGVEGSLE